MQLTIELENIQHIKSLRVDIDLNRNGLTCVVGKNGIGKTTLIKSIRNLKVADTFSKMAQPGALRQGSKIRYSCDGVVFDFEYDRDIQDLNGKAVFPASLKAQIDVELPMPWGQRFSTFQSVSSADLDIRTAVMLQDYIVPDELILLLSNVYGDDKFSSLKEIKIGKNSFYVIPLENDRYVREDHLSSGEFFLISLYRKLKSATRLIVIDEIDISLDAAAQSRLIGWLRGFCEREGVNVFFTTHSMAIMRTMNDGELHFLHHEDGLIKATAVSYNYIKSVLFGFAGWDRYILTEDLMLEGFFHYLISVHRIPAYYSYQIIPVGGGDNVVQLLRKNSVERFLGDEHSVTAILDGDYVGTRNARQKGVFCIPFPSVEKQIFEDYKAGKFRLDKDLESEPSDNKAFKKAVKKVCGLCPQDFYNYLNDSYPEEVGLVCDFLKEFLAQPAS